MYCTALILVICLTLLTSISGDPYGHCGDLKFCDWSVWNSWTSCSNECGYGLRNRTKLICCPPDVKESEISKCVVDYCNFTMNQYVQKQQCTSRINCPTTPSTTVTTMAPSTTTGRKTTVTVNTPPRGKCENTPYFHCDWAGWTPWSGCSNGCGQGNRNRTQNICCPRNITASMIKLCIVDYCGFSMSQHEQTETCYSKRTCTTSLGRRTMTAGLSTTPSMQRANNTRSVSSSAGTYIKRPTTSTLLHKPSPSRLNLKLNTKNTTIGVSSSLVLQNMKTTTKVTNVKGQGSLSRKHNSQKISTARTSQKYLSKNYLKTTKPGVIKSQITNYTKTGTYSSTGLLSYKGTRTRAGQNTSGNTAFPSTKQNMRAKTILVSNHRFPIPSVTFSNVNFNTLTRKPVNKSSDSNISNGYAHIGKNYSGLNPYGVNTLNSGNMKPIKNSYMAQTVQGTKYVNSLHHGNSGIGSTALVFQTGSQHSQNMKPNPTGRMQAVNTATYSNGSMNSQNKYVNRQSKATNTYTNMNIIKTTKPLIQFSNNPPATRGSGKSSNAVVKGTNIFPPFENSTDSKTSEGLGILTNWPFGILTSLFGAAVLLSVLGCVSVFCLFCLKNCRKRNQKVKVRPLPLTKRPKRRF